MIDLDLLIVAHAKGGDRSHVCAIFSPNKFWPQKMLTLKMFSKFATQPVCNAAWAADTLCSDQFRIDLVCLNRFSLGTFEVFYTFVVMSVVDELFRVTVTSWLSKWIIYSQTVLLLCVKTNRQRIEISLFAVGKHKSQITSNKKWKLKVQNKYKCIQENNFY